MHTIELRCGCNRPYASVYNGVFSVVSRHGGHQHVNACSMSWLLEVLRASRDADLTTLILPSGFKLLRKAPPPKLIRERNLQIGKEEMIPMIAPLCHESDCARPWALIAHGCLMIDAWHQFEHHANLIKVEHLEAAIPNRHWSQVFQPAFVTMVAG